MKEISIKCEGFAQAPIDELIPLQGKLKSLSKQNYNRLKKQILRLGFSEPISVWRNNDSYYILNGHQRLRVLKQMVEKEGYTCPPIPINPVEAKDENEAKEKVLSLTSQFGDIENQGLYEFLQNTTIDVSSLEDNYRLPDVDFNEFLAEYYDEPMTEGKTDEDSVPEVDEKATNVKLGDIWQLGEHRLACGDSTCDDAVSRLMDGEKADIGFTSPPYNIGNSVRGNMYRDNTDDKSDFVEFLNKFTKIYLSKCRFLFVNIQALSNNWRDVFDWQNVWLHKLKDVLIWNKSQCPPNIQKGSFNTKFEFIYAFTDDPFNGRNFPCKWQGKYPNVIETNSNSNNEFAGIHKAGFPVSLPQWLIEKMDFCSTVVDPFGGTGSTLIACEKTNRKCFMMEIDPHYCQVIIDRWEQYTGKKAVKL